MMTHKLQANFGPIIRAFSTLGASSVPLSSPAGDNLDGLALLNPSEALDSLSPWDDLQKEARPYGVNVPLQGVRPLLLPPGDPFAHLISVDDWADAINMVAGLQTTNMVAFGCLIHASKLSLKYGQWEELFRRRWENRVPFGKSTGKKWDSIGDVCGQLGQEPDHLASLPCCFEALYHVSRLGLKLLKDLIRDGAIRPDLSEAKAKELVKRYRPDLTRPARPLNASRVRAKLRACAALIIEKGKDADLEPTAMELEELAGLMRAEMVRRQQALEEIGIEGFRAGKEERAEASVAA